MGVVFAKILEGVVSMDKGGNGENGLDHHCLREGRLSRHLPLDVIAEGILCAWGVELLELPYDVRLNLQ
jgi:hypothetical protein